MHKACLRLLSTNALVFHIFCVRISRRRMTCIPVLRQNKKLNHFIVRPNRVGQPCPGPGVSGARAAVSKDDHTHFEDSIRN